MSVSSAFRTDCYMSWAMMVMVWVVPTVVHVKRPRVIPAVVASIVPRIIPSIMATIVPRVIPASSKVPAGTVIIWVIIPWVEISVAAPIAEPPSVPIRTISP